MEILTLFNDDRKMFPAKLKQCTEQLQSFTNLIVRFNWRCAGISFYLDETIHMLNN